MSQPRPKLLNGFDSSLSWMNSKTKVYFFFHKVWCKNSFPIFLINFYDLRNIATKYFWLFLNHNFIYFPGKNNFQTLKNWNKNLEKIGTFWLVFGNFDCFVRQRRNSGERTSISCLFLSLDLTHIFSKHLQSKSNSFVIMLFLPKYSVIGADIEPSHTSSDKVEGHS